MTLQATLTDARSTWKAYDQWIEVNADSAAYESASPENALVLIGPNRKPLTMDSLTPVGLIQNFTIGQSINWQAQQMIGSGRTFFLAGKAPGNGTLSRLFTKTSTLLGAMYQQAISKIGETTLAQQESAAWDEKKEIMFTLDSELLKVPVGMAAFFRDTTRAFIGGFYVENMVIPNINMSFAVGQPAIFETVNILFDRVVPFDLGSTLINEDELSAFDNAVRAPGATT